MPIKHHILFLLACVAFFCVNGQDYSAIEFVENKGQWDNNVRFMAKAPAGGVFLHTNGFTILQHSPQDWEQVTDIIHGHGTEEAKQVILGNKKFDVRSHAYRVEFVGAAANPQIIPDKPLFSYNNYFIGNDPSKWATNCQLFQGVTVRNIYPGVDVRYYSNNGQMKYDLMVQPGADLSKIVLRYKGIDQLKVEGKELVIPTSVGNLRELDPYTYQVTDKGRKAVTARYVVKGNEVRFDVKNYDKKSTLIIDPSLVFCSFSGSRADNWGFTATYGADGSLYGGGIVEDNGFPVSPGAFKSTYGGGTWDIGIIKLSPDGRSRVYATYIGGGGIEQPHSLVVDDGGNLVLAGRSNSEDYPVTGATIGKGGGYDIVVTKLNATGTALIGSRKIGGSGDDGANISADRLGGARSLQRNYGDDGRSEVIVDGGGNIYVASCTRSNDFEIVGGFQSRSGGQQDGVVLKLPPDVSRLSFSSYLGGGGNDAAYVLSLHPFNNNIYVGGGTESNNANNFPGDKSNSIGTDNHGSVDGYVAVISNDGSNLIHATYLGTGGIDQVYGIQFDRLGFPYVMGQTTGSWPIKAPWSQPGGKQFIAKLEPDLSAFIYSTAFGTGSAIPNISPVAFLVDRCENVYVSGWGGEFGNINFPSAGTSGLSVTPDAIKSTTDVGATGVGQDFYFFVLKRDGLGQLYGSFFGQNGAAPDHVDGGTSRFDRNGVIYQAICANCKTFGSATFPTTPGAWATSNPSQSCNLAMVKIAFNLAGVRSGIQAAINGVPRDTAGCVPLTVDFTDTIQDQDDRTFEWYFGDNSAPVKTTEPKIAHTYDQIGSYRVMLIAIDSATCNIRDTSYLNIKVGDVQATPALTAERVLPCDRFEFNFTNTTPVSPRLNFGPNAFVWDFGDGTVDTVDYSAAPVTHVYAGPGTYKVQLHLIDENFCNAPEFAEVVVSAGPLKAAFTAPETGCAPFAVPFKNESVGALEYLWDFGDGATSTEENPEHVYTTGGTYVVTLSARSPAPCFKEEKVSFTITVYDAPIADFSAAPQPPVANTPITFTNLSSPSATRFVWNFGDGDTLATTSRGPVTNDYNESATYTVCLTAYNQLGCADDTCKTVESLAEFAVDVPNAFTPLSGDENSKVFARAYGVSKLKFIIWNRWGQKVFETENRKQGWDGYFKGALLPMDVYVYTLEVEFFDGKKAAKKGDITLIR